MEKSTTVVAVDGPAASGKGTISKALASHFSLAYLDTGQLYRSVTAEILKRIGPTFSPEEAACIAKNISKYNNVDQELRSSEVSRMVPRVAQINEVRIALTRYQKEFAKDPSHFISGCYDGAILDGRDIGTVVIPNAIAKLYVSASPEVRAMRRARQLGETYDTVLHDILERDRLDSEREASPMRPAPDALLLDTTNLTIDAAVAKAVAFVESRFEPDGE